MPIRMWTRSKVCDTVQRKSTVSSDRKRRLAMTENLTLGDLTRFIWFRSDDALWADYDQREALVPQPAIERSPAEWQARIGESAAEYSLDPWMIVERGSSYEPLRDESAMFREFAALSVNRDSYLEFARSYGPLTGRPGVALPDRLSIWLAEQYRMKRAVGLLDALNNQVTDDLRGLGIRTEPALPWGTLAYLTFRGRELGAIHDDASASEAPSKVVAAVYRAVGECDSKVLVSSDSSSREIVQAVLTRTVTDALARYDVAPTLEPDGSTLPNGSGLRLSFEVRSLAGAMWLQLLLAADENRTYRTCPVCGRWWDATDARSHKVVCSDRCRAKKAYEARKEVKTNDEEIQR